MIKQVSQLVSFPSLGRQNSVPARMSKSSVCGRLLLLLGVLGFELAISPHAHAQGATAWFLSNPPPDYTTPSTPVAQGPYSTAAQACTAYSGTLVGDWGTATETFEQGASASSSGHPPGSYFCSEIIDQTVPPSPMVQYYYATSPYVAELSSGYTNSYFTEGTVTQAQVSCHNCVADPINPGVGNVFETETDVRFAGASPIVYQRFYNSADSTGSDGVPGWRHSYDRSITQQSRI